MRRPQHQTGIARSGDGRGPQRRRYNFRRRSQVVKAEVCKTSTRRFESARRLQLLSRLYFPSFRRP